MASYSFYSFKSFKNSSSDHENLVLITVQQLKLVYHHLHRLLEMRPHALKHHHVVKFEGQQSGPPADGQIFAVHTVKAAVLGDPVKR